MEERDRPQFVPQGARGSRPEPVPDAFRREFHFLLLRYLASTTSAPVFEAARADFEERALLPDSAGFAPPGGAARAATYNELILRYRNMNSHRLLQALWTLAHRASPIPAATTLLGSGRFALPTREAVSRTWLEQLAQTKRNCPSTVYALLGRSIGMTGMRNVAQPSVLAGAMQRHKLLIGHKKAVYCLALDPTGRLLATGSDDTLVKLWDTRNGKLLKTLRGFTEEVCVVRFFKIPRSKTSIIACGSNDNFVRVWRVPDGYPVVAFSGHDDPVTDIALLHNDHAVRLCSASFDGTILCRDMRNYARPPQIIRPGTGDVLQLCPCARDSSVCFAAAKTDIVRLRMNERGWIDVTRVFRLAHDASSLALASDGCTLLAGALDGGSAAVWTTHAQRAVSTALVPEDAPDGARRVLAAALSADGSTAVLSVAERAVDAEDQPGDAEARAGGDAAAIAIRTRRAGQARETYAIEAWNTSGRCTRRGRLQLHSDECYVLLSHPNEQSCGSVVASAGYDGAVCLFDVSPRHGAPHVLWRAAETSAVSFVEAAFNRDGSVLVAAGDDGRIVCFATSPPGAVLTRAPVQQFFTRDYATMTVVDPQSGDVVDDVAGVAPHLSDPGVLCDADMHPYEENDARLHDAADEDTALRLFHSDDDDDDDANAEWNSDLDDEDEEDEDYGGRGAGEDTPQTRRSMRTQRAARPRYAEDDDEDVSEEEAREATRQSARSSRVRRNPQRFISSEDDWSGSSSSGAAPPTRRRRRAHASSEDESFGSASEDESSDASSDASWGRARRRKRQATRRGRPSRGAKRRRRLGGEELRANAQWILDLPAAARSGARVHEPPEDPPQCRARLTPLLPQPGMRVVYLRRGHEEALAEQGMVGGARDAAGTSDPLPWELLHAPAAECTVKSVSFTREQDTKAVVARCELESAEGTCFWVVVRRDAAAEFVLPCALLDRASPFTSRAQIGARVRAWFLEGDSGTGSWYRGAITAVRPSEDDGDERLSERCREAHRWWKAVTVRWDCDGEGTDARTDTAADDGYSPWELEWDTAEPDDGSTDTVPPVIPLPSWPATAEARHHLLETLRDVLHDPIFGPFTEEVRVEEVPDYYDIVVVPMCLQLIQRRVRRLYYMSKESFAADASMLHANAVAYNGDHAMLTTTAARLRDLLLDAADECAEEEAPRSGQ